jgi:hypothetical protein
MKSIIHLFQFERRFFLFLFRNADNSRISKDCIVVFYRACHFERHTIRKRRGYFYVKIAPVILAALVW